MPEDAEGNYIPDWAVRPSPAARKVVSAPEIPRGHKISSRESNNGAVLMQVIGVLLCFTVIGALLGIPLILQGGMMCRVYRCSNCGNKVDKKSKICPTCRCELD